MRRIVGRGYAVFVALAALSAACGGGEEAQPPAEEAQQAAPQQAPQAAAPAMPEAALPAGVTQEMVAQGQQIFMGAGICYTCHGPDAKGTPLAPDLTDNTWINVDGSYDAIVQLVKTGVAQPEEHQAPMPPMGGAQLAEDQVRAVAAYVYTLTPR
ncbi:MAG: cytochrome c [Gemmatimonadetes bacterium]|nr:cytochrome c [Gemmatimonadota bacterium]